MPALGAFLSNTSLAFFAFLMANTGAGAASMSGLLHIPVFVLKIDRAAESPQSLSHR